MIVAFYKYDPKTFSLEEFNRRMHWCFRLPRNERGDLPCNLTPELNMDFDSEEDAMAFILAFPER